MMADTSDLCESLPLEMLRSIIRFLDAEDLNQCKLLNSSWREAATTPYIWQELCEQLWKDKVYVPQKFRDMLHSDPTTAYYESKRDSTRDVITTEELLSFDWWFRFKEIPGAWYSDRDPWMNGRQPSLHKYQKDGVIKIKGEFSGAAPDRRYWQWLEEDNVKEGSWIQICQYPSYKVHRTANWGWMQQSELALLINWPIPPKGTCPELEDANLPKLPPSEDSYIYRNFNVGGINNAQHPLIQLLLQRLGHVHAGGFIFNMMGMDDDDEDEDEDVEINDNENNDEEANDEEGSEEDMDEYEALSEEHDEEASDVDENQHE